MSKDLSVVSCVRAVESEESVIEERINDPHPGVHQGTSEEPEVQTVEPESKTRRKTHNLTSKTCSCVMSCHLTLTLTVSPSECALPLSFPPSIPPSLPPSLSPSLSSSLSQRYFRLTSIFVALHYVPHISLTRVLHSQDNSRLALVDHSLLVIF